MRDGLKDGLTDRGTGIYGDDSMKKDSMAIAQMANESMAIPY